MNKHHAPQPSNAEKQVMQRMLAEHGLIFDPNYMVKTYMAMEQMAKQGVFNQIDHLVLVHSGGQIGLFDNNRLFELPQVHHNIL